MKPVAVIVLLLLFSEMAVAQAQFSLQPRAGAGTAPQPLLGIWGTAEQCAAHESGNNDNPRLFPYRISGDWIRQGNIYCYLSWRDHEGDSDGLRAYALAQCGEDNLREYQLRLLLQQGELQIRWSEDFTTRALRAC